MKKDYGPIYDSWVPSTPQANETEVLEVPNPDYVTWLEDTFNGLQEAIANGDGERVSLIESEFVRSASLYWKFRAKLSKEKAEEMGWNAEHGSFEVEIDGEKERIEAKNNARGGYFGDYSINRRVNGRFDSVTIKTGLHETTSVVLTTITQFVHYMPPIDAYKIELSNGRIKSFETNVFQNTTDVNGRSRAIVKTQRINDSFVI